MCLSEIFIYLTAESAEGAERKIEEKTRDVHKLFGIDLVVTWELGNSRINSKFYK